MSDSRHPLSGLPRSWRFPGLRGLREAPQHLTYGRFDLDRQPIVAGIDGLDWLENAPPSASPSIAASNRDNYPEKALTLAALDSLCGDLPIPTTLRTFAAREDLQEKVGSDLLLPRPGRTTRPDVRRRWVPNPFSRRSANVASLVNIPRCQRKRSCRHAVDVRTPRIRTGLLLGSVRRRLGHGRHRARRTARSVCRLLEFLYRFWLENELWQSLRHGWPLLPAQADYVTSLRLKYGREV